jgi:hypothetical protein
MHRTITTAATAALSTGLAIGLAIGVPTTASATVKEKDVASQGDIVKAFPELDGGTFTTTKTKKLLVPGTTCGVTSPLKVGSNVVTTGVSTTGFPAATAGATEFKTESQAKKFLRTYSKFITRCASFTEPSTGATVTIEKAKAPKLGQDRVASVQTIAFSGTTSYSATVVVRDGKRIAQVALVDDAAVSIDPLNSLAKVAVKKLR